MAGEGGGRVLRALPRRVAAAAAAAKRGGGAVESAASGGAIVESAASGGRKTTSSRFLLQGYVNEFHNTLESAKTKLANSNTMVNAINLSTTHRVNASPANDPIPYGIPHRELWVRLEQHVEEMQPITCITATFMIGYAALLRARADAFPLSNYARRVSSYARHVADYAHLVLFHAAQARCWDLLTDQAQAELDRVRSLVQQASDNLEKEHRRYDDRYEDGDGDEDEYEYEDDIGLEKLHDMFPVPHDAILTDEMLMICKFQQLSCNLRG